MEAIMFTQATTLLVLPIFLMQTLLPLLFLLVLIYMAEKDKGAIIPTKITYKQLHFIKFLSEKLNCIKNCFVHF